MYSAGKIDPWDPGFGPSEQHNNHTDFDYQREYDKSPNYDHREFDHQEREHRSLEYRSHRRDRNRERDRSRDKRDRSREDRDRSYRDREDRYSSRTRDSLIGKRQGQGPC